MRSSTRCPHAYSWIVEDYVLGLRDDYPESVRRMDEYGIEGLRSFNEQLPATERIRMRYIDMNHAHDAPMLSLSWMARRTPAGERIEPVVGNVLATRAGTDEYVAAVTELEGRLVAERDTLVETLGSTWYDRLAEAVEIEIWSLPIRRRHDGIHASGS